MPMAMDVMVSNTLIFFFMHTLCPSYADIDECAEGTDRCSQNCHNTIGSYTCSCNTGYRLNADGVTCDGGCS